MRKAIGVLFVAAALVFGIGAAAQAGTGGDTCKVSPNWTVGVSATYSDLITVNGVTSGFLDYVVMTSPAALLVGSSSYTWYLADGSNTTKTTFTFRGVINGKYTYRADPNKYDVVNVGVNPAAASNGATCYQYQGVAFVPVT